MVFRVAFRKVIVRLSKHAWAYITILLSSLYVLGMILMPYFEGSDGTFGSFSDYSWWFIVTITTVGYGDISPETFGGRTVAIVIMIFGITALATVATKIFSAVAENWRKKMAGELHLGESGHVVIFGYHSGETELLVKEILADSSHDQEIVLCSSRVGENPIPEKIEFVRGKLTSEDTLTRSCTSKASKVIVHGHDDNESILVALAVRNINPNCHVVVELDDVGSEAHIKRIDPKIECVKPISIHMIVQSMQDPGTTEIVSRLLSNQVDSTLSKTIFPHGKSISYGELSASLKRVCEVTLIAVVENGGEADLNPPSYFILKGGESLFYISERRLTEDQLNSVL